MNIKTLLINESKDFEYKNIFFILLVHTCKYSLLPEFYEIFGKEHLLKFLEIFEGTTIKVPSAKEIERAARDVDIYLRLNKSKKFRTTIINELASYYQISVKDIYRIYIEMNKILKDFDLKGIENAFKRRKDKINR